MTPDNNTQLPPAPADEPAVVPAATTETPTSDKGWINKEEYQRLQQTPTPVAVAGVVKPPKLFSGLQVASTTIASVALLLGLLWGLSYMILLAIAVLVIGGVFTLIDYIAAKKPGQLIRRHKVRNIILLVVACLVLSAPVIVVIAAIIALFVLCATGQCSGT